MGCKLFVEDQDHIPDVSHIQHLPPVLLSVRGSGAGGWMIQAKIQVYLWLGSIKHKKNYPSGLPPGFQPTNELQNAERPAVPPPPIIHYSEKHVSSHLLKEMLRSE